MVVVITQKIKVVPMIITTMIIELAMTKIGPRNSSMYSSDRIDRTKIKSQKIDVVIPLKSWPY